MGDQYDEFGEGRKHVSFRKKINVNRQDFKYLALFTFTFILGVMLKQILPSIGAFGFKIPLTIQGKQYFQLKCKVRNRISQFHECLENTTKCFLKTTMDFVIGIGSKEPKHRFSWGLILDKLQLRSILYPLSQQKVWWISQLRRLESSSPGSSFPAEICCLISILIIYSDASESMS